MIRFNLFRDFKESVNEFILENIPKIDCCNTITSNLNSYEKFNKVNKRTNFKDSRSPQIVKKKNRKRRKK